MGTKLGLHSADFLHALTHRQLLLSLAFSVALGGVAGAVVTAEATRSLVAGTPAWLVGVAGAVVVPIAVGYAYARRADELEDETLGLVDVGTLPGSEPRRSADGQRGAER